MTASFVVLRLVGKAVLNFVGAGILGDVVVEVADQVCKTWKSEATPAQQNAQLSELAQASAGTVRAEAEAVAREIAADRSLEEQQQLVSYLTQIPGAIRRTLRRPSDPSGATVPPGLSLRSTQEVLQILPRGEPKYRAGAKPEGLPDWQLEELLGSGGFGEVWLARNPILQEVSAIKFCLDKQASTSLRNEAKLLARLKGEKPHPGVVQLLDTCLSVDPPNLRYEYIPGGDLGSLVREWYQDAQGPPSVQVVSATLVAIANTVGYFHQLNPPIVHRDLKPANILVQPAAPGQYIFKVADFGIGGLAARGALERATRQVTGQGDLLVTSARGAYTVHYASPQQARGEDPDPRDDVHALGVIWYQMLVGKLDCGPPTGRKWPQHLRERGLDDDTIDLLASCFEPRPEDRPDHAGVLAEKLQQRLVNVPAPVQPAPVQPAPVQPAPPVQSPQPATLDTAPVAANSPAIIQESQPKKVTLRSAIPVTWPQTNPQTNPNAHSEDLAPPPSVPAPQPVTDTAPMDTVAGPDVAERGSALLWLGAPYVRGPERFCHFSWSGNTFWLRDFMGGELQHDPADHAHEQHWQRIGPTRFSRDQIWNSARKRLPCTGDLRVSVYNFAWWQKTLDRLTSSHGGQPMALADVAHPLAIPPTLPEVPRANPATRRSAPPKSPAPLAPVTIQPAYPSSFSTGDRDEDQDEKRGVHFLDWRHRAMAWIGWILLHFMLSNHMDSENKFFVVALVTSVPVALGCYFVRTTSSDWVVAGFYILGYCAGLEDPQGQWFGGFVMSLCAWIFIAIYGFSRYLFFGIR